MTVALLCESTATAVTSNIFCKKCKLARISAHCSASLQNTLPIELEVSNHRTSTTGNVFSNIEFNF